MAALADWWQAQPKLTRATLWTYALAALLIVVMLNVGCSPRVPRFAPPPPTAAPAAAPDPLPGESTPDYIGRLKGWQDATLAKQSATSEVKKAGRSDAADDTFLANVKATAFWLSLVLAAAAVALFVLACFPWGRALGADWGDSARCMIFVACTQIGSHFMLKFGIYVSYFLAAVIAVALVAALWYVVVPMLKARGKRRKHPAPPVAVTAEHNPVLHGTLSPESVGRSDSAGTGGATGLRP